MHLAVGLLRPTVGDVEVFGWSPRDTPMATLARVGFLAQDRPLFAALSVEETLGFGRRLNPRWDDKAARDRLTNLEIDFRTRVGRLSGGQQAQVALSVAIAKRPDLLLLDEPLANLDPLARVEVSRVLLTAVAEQGITVVYSSHVVSELENHCDYLVLINSGRVQLAGPIDELIADHAVFTGPSEEVGRLQTLPTVISAKSGSRMATVVARRTAMLSVHDSWEAHELTLEELVLAYMENPRAAVLPPPAVVEEAS
jgi:ABC-2 type transport system ATP-binding protein